MKTKTIAARTKCIVAALILSMSIGVMPVYAVQPVQETNVAVEQSQDSVEEKAAAYFANFPEDKHVVSAADFLKMVENKENICVLDIRSAEDYAAGHIQGAINVPYGVDIAEALDKIPDDVEVLVYCYSGQTASQTVALLNLAGKNAYNVSGGFTGISKEEAAAALTVKEAADFGEKTYPVDAQIKETIQEYYEVAAENGKFNLSAEQVKQAIADDEIYLVDLRSENDYLKSHIAGATRNIPFGKGMEKALAKLTTDKPIVFQCYSGQTASQTTAALRVKGYRAYNLSGGMGAEGGSGWLGAGYAVVKYTTQQFLNEKVDRYFANLPENKN